MHKIIKKHTQEGKIMFTDIFIYISKIQLFSFGLLRKFVILNLVRLFRRCSLCSRIVNKNKIKRKIYINSPLFGLKIKSMDYYVLLKADLR